MSTNTSRALFKQYGSQTAPLTLPPSPDGRRKPVPEFSNAPLPPNYTKRKPAPAYPDPRPAHIRAANAPLDAFWETRSSMRGAIVLTRERAYSGVDGEDIRIMELERRTAVALELGDLELDLLVQNRKRADARRAREAEEKRWEEERVAEAERTGQARVRAVARWRKDVPSGEVAVAEDKKARVI
ncbi:hypothetical protein PENSPDRAFT_664650 [Peniophora sp. CONT]|nr:hypothetical protein PENSPDRAFT_664650 [Peniophora sp. CONT]